jgi:hypothetical protein
MQDKKHKPIGWKIILIGHPVVLFIVDLIVLIIRPHPDTQTWLSFLLVFIQDIIWFIIMAIWNPDSDRVKAFLIIYIILISIPAVLILCADAALRGMW